MDENIRFSAKLRVPIGYLNYGNHVDATGVTLIIQDARMRFLKSLGMTEINIEKDIGYVLTDVIINQKAEILYDDELMVDMIISKITKAMMELKYIVKSTTTNKVVALCESKHFFYNHQVKKLSSIKLETIKIIST